MLTSIDSIDASSAALAGYLTKPVRPSQLFDALMGLFGVGFAESAERAAVAPNPTSTWPSDSRCGSSWSKTTR